MRGWYPARRSARVEERTIVSGAPGSAGRSTRSPWITTSVPLEHVLRVDRSEEALAGPSTTGTTSMRHLVDQARGEHLARRA